MKIVIDQEQVVWASFFISVVAILGLAIWIMGKVCPNQVSHSYLSEPIAAIYYQPRSYGYAEKWTYITKDRNSYVDYQDGRYLVGDRISLSYTECESN